MLALVADVEESVINFGEVHSLFDLLLSPLELVIDVSGAADSFARCELGSLRHLACEVDWILAVRGCLWEVLWDRKKAVL